MTTTTANGRTFKLRSEGRCMPFLEADLIKRGYDGTVWYGISAPTGRQRTHKTGLFYRTTAGTFEPVLIH